MPVGFRSLYKSHLPPTPLPIQGGRITPVLTFEKLSRLHAIYIMNIITLHSQGQMYTLSFSTEWSRRDWTLVFTLRRQRARSRGHSCQVVSQALISKLFGCLDSPTSYSPESCQRLLCDSGRLERLTVNIRLFTRQSRPPIDIHTNYERGLSSLDEFQETVSCTRTEISS